jgi:hypothetical protein
MDKYPSKAKNFTTNFFVDRCMKILLWDHQLCFSTKTNTHQFSYVLVLRVTDPSISVSMFLGCMLSSNTPQCLNGKKIEN